MKATNTYERYFVFFTIIIWGSLWGIFEATVGYLIHLIEFNVSFIIWYPASCFFMANVYRKTHKKSAVIWVGFLCASIKLLNLFLPIRIDKVINPAISIVFESLAMALVIFVAEHMLGDKKKNLLVKALTVFTMNTGWRLFYALFLLFLVPDWMRGISVISSAKKFIPFFVTQNFITTLILFIGYQFADTIFKPIKTLENKISSLKAALPSHVLIKLKVSIVALMFCTSIVLELLL